MPLWLQVTFAVCSIVVGPLVGYLSAKRGAERGTAVALAVHDTLINEIKSEVAKLRDAKHLHASRITEHEAWIDVLKRKAGIG